MMMGKHEGDPRYLLRDRGPDGVERLYVRKRGRTRKIRIKEAFGTPGFWRAYADAVEQLGKPELKAVPKPKERDKSGYERGTFGWLAGRYYNSDEFGMLDPTSQITRRRVIDSCLAEPFSESDPERMGNCPLKFLTPRKVKRLRDLKAGLPGAANNRKKYLSAMFTWGVEAELMASNPARDVQKKKYATDGFHTWSEAEVAAFEKRHPVGTKARLALALFLYLGVRRGDMVKLGPGNIHEATEPGEPRTIRFTPGKTTYKRLRESVKPILPALEEILSTSPCGLKTFVETEHGRPFSAKGFGPGCGNGATKRPSRSSARPTV